MLVLKRKVGEIIRIGDHIEVHVLAVEGEVLKLGFVAPRHVSIMRSEIYEAIRQENLQAGKQENDPKRLLHLLGRKPNDA
ncbi:Translational regulator CsrA [Paenibacillus plantiphilus]|uniref:Translational regulator CsrA n=1 Tax=Paenibacillus plantiphilus TaxID=2905650 RepID=A0ABN8G016_9BACL|nr:carbon storage regulator CsrA [Paenibacillus plantiphilus]CAH1192983.1 Translational regulator CsrA [Paenibacillus plantiphilus]